MTEKELFLSALEIPITDRKAFVESQTEDISLQNRVWLLLEAEAKSQSFLLEQLDAHALKSDPETPFFNSYRSLIHPHYSFGKLLGYGGFSEVYEGTRLIPFTQEVALKVLQNTSSKKENLIQEAKILGSLNHPNIAQIYDFDQLPDGRFFLVMERIKGMPITQYCDVHKLGIKERIQLFGLVCEAVSYAHQNLVIHRDIKPSNILVTEEGVVKLLDFGVAKIVSNDTQTELTVTSQTPFTPAYAAPEQIQRKPIGTTTDVYSLGLLLYEMLVGKLPYNIKAESSPVEMEKIIVLDDIKYPSTWFKRGHLPEIDEIVKDRNVSAELMYKVLRGDLDEIINKALRKEPQERYSSVIHLREDISRYLANQPILAQAPSWQYVAKKFIRRHKWGVGTFGAFVLSLTLGLGIVLWQNNQITKANEKANLEVEKSNKIRQFMSETLLLADINLNGVKVDTLKYKTAINMGLSQIEKLKEQPDVYAEMMHLFGMIYQNWGETKKAIELYEKAYFIAQKHKIKDVALQYDLPNRIAGLYKQQGFFNKAQQLYKDIIVQGKENQVPDSTLAIGMNNWGVTLLDQGDYTTSLKTLQEALRLDKTRVIKTPTALLSAGIAYANLGRVLTYLGDFSEAQNMLNISKDFKSRSSLGKSSFLTSDLYLALLKIDKGKDLEASKELYDLISKRHALMGSKHHTNINDKLGLSIALYHLGRFSPALDTLRAILPLQEKTFGASSSLLFSIQLYSALCLVEFNRFDEAKILFQDILASKGFIAPRTKILAMMGLAKVYDIQKERNKALEWVRQAVTVAREKEGYASRYVAKVLYEYAQILFHAQQLSQAKSTLDEAIQIYRNLLPQNHPEAEKAITLRRILDSEDKDK